MCPVRSLELTLKPDQQLLNQQIIFPHDGLCFISIESYAPFSYQFHSIDSDTYYSDEPILCRGKKELLPFGSYKGSIFSFDFHNKYSEENHIKFNVRFEHRQPSAKHYSFREYTLNGLYLRTPIDIEAGKEVEISLTNFRGGHYEIHRIHSHLERKMSCKIKYGNQIVEDFQMGDVYALRKPWILRWPDSAVLCLKNEGNSKLEIRPTEIHLAGYLLKPVKILEKVAPLNARNSFRIEGISI